jgi:DNA-binding SARP family transcriptional activator/DNA-binding XRE family transcriptional regulator
MEYQFGESAPRFGSAIRAHRHALGLSQHELAVKAGLSVATVRDFEQGRRLRPRPNSLFALVSALGLDPEQTADLVRAAASVRRRRGLPALHNGDLTPTAGALVPRHGLWVAALGPLEAWRDGRPLALGPPGRRVVLGLLLLNSGARVRRDTIIDALWGETPPGTAVSLVQAHVSRLRRTLEPTGPALGGRVIESVRGAYRLCLPDWELDLLVFRDMVAKAAAKRVSDDNVTAYRLYEDAIALWQGDPLSDVELLRRYPGAMLLQQQLAGVLLGYADVACALGHHDKVIPRLWALAAAEPLNEAVAARLMIALAGAGQQAVAIRVYEDLRSRLDRELGVYPSEDLVDAHLRVLRQDIGAGNQVAHTRATAYVVPR